MPAPPSHNTDMTGQVAFVTGAARGIGAAVCRTLAASGVDVAVADLRDGTASADDVQGRGRRALPLELDVTDAEAVATAVDRTVAELGRVDILVCCAGICPAGGMEADLVQWEDVLKINVDGTYYCIRAVWPHMRAANYGKIVTVASMAAHRGGVIVGPEYSASKGAVAALTHHTARNGGPHNIYCNAVSPGVIDTELVADFDKPGPEVFPLGRLGTPEDVAEPIRFLCSPASNYITGVVVAVAGGLFFNT